MKKLGLRLFSIMMALMMVMSSESVSVMADTVSGNQIISDDSAEENNVIVADDEITIKVEPELYTESGDEEVELNIEATGGEVTRASWLSQLVTEFGLTVDAANYPDNYYSDLTSTDANYATVMIATEYGLIDAEDDGKVRLQENATREFATYSLNRILGLELEEDTYTFSDSADCAYPNDAQIAVNQGWLSLIDGKFAPDTALTAAEASAMISGASAIHNSNTINDSHDNTYVFADYVIVVPEATEVVVDSNCVVTITNLSQTINGGDTFVVYECGLPSVYKATSVVQSGSQTIINTTEADVDSAIVSMDSEGISEVEFSDIVANEELTVESVATEERALELSEEYSLKVTKDDIIFTGDVELQGVKAEVVVNLNNLKLKHNIKTSQDYYYVTLCGDLSSNLIIDWDALDAAGISGSVYLCSAKVGGVGNVSITLEYNISGRYETYNSASFEVGFKHTSSGGSQLIKKYTKKKSVNNTTIDGSLALRTTFSVNVLDVVKGTIFAQFGAKAQYVRRTFSDGELPSQCETFTTWLFVDGRVNVSYGVGNLRKSAFNKSFVVFDKSNSPAYTTFHVEDGKQVSSCTRGLSTGRYGGWGYFSPVDTQYGAYTGTGASSKGTGSNGEPYTIYTYELDDNNNATITGYNGNVSALTIPETLDGYTVTAIGNSAFKGNTLLISARIPDSVTTISHYAFENCSNLSSVKLSNKLSYLGTRAFYNCDKLSSIVIPKALTEAANGSNSTGPFAQCDTLETINFESGTTRIACYLFDECTGLKNVTIPDTVTSIDTGAFRDCENLKTVTLSDNLTTINNSAFNGCTSLEKIVIPDSVTTISHYAFENCTSLKEAYVSDSVSSIGTHIFYGCISLETVHIPNGGKNINSYMFYNCKKLKTINWPETLIAVQDYAFYNCDALTEVTLPKNVTTVKTYAFYDCDALTKVTIPDSVTALGTYTFNHCDLLSDVSLGTGLTSIPSYAFANCAALEDVVIPYRVTAINQYAFNACTALKNVTIPRSVESVGTQVFSYPGNMTIYGIKGTYAETYAIDNSINFVNKEVNATAINLNVTSLKINKGSSQRLVLTVTPSNFTDEVSWKSSNTAVATVAADGTVKAVGGGTATIKVVVGNVSKSCNVTVTQPVTSISLSSTSKTVEAGETFTLTATAYPTNANNRAVTWSSSDPSVATVSNTGVVKTLKKGTAKITATAKDGSGVSKSCTVTVSSQLYRVTNVSELQSPHPYTNSCSDRWTYTLSGAKSIAVKFNASTEVESRYDYIFIYDKNGNQIGKYTGTDLAGKTITITGDTVTIKLKSDSSSTEYGFKVDSVKAVGNSTGSSTGNSSGGSTSGDSDIPEGPDTWVGKTGTEGFVYRLYNVAMGREADSAGLNDWNNKLVTKEMTAAQVAQGFIFSQEFKNHNYSDEQYVKILYRTMFGREADEGGLSGWMKDLQNGMTREYVFRGFAESQEFSNLCGNYGIERGSVTATSYRDRNYGITSFMARCYTKALGRDFDEDGLEYWCMVISNGQYTIDGAATNGFFHSQEFINKNTTNEEYVTILYYTFFDREPDEAGFNDWINQLNSGAKNRDEVMAGFSNSREFAYLKAKYGL